MPAFPATLYDDLRPALAHRGIMLKLESIAISVENQVAHLQLNRPDRANAMDDTLWRELHQAFDWASDTPEVRAVILSGNGKHFCAGIDLQMLIGLQQQIQDHCEARKREKLLLTIERLQRAVSSIEHCRKPVIAAIHGACVGGGLDIALAADIRLAADDAFFSVKEVEIGMVADLGTLQRLAGNVGEGRARELAMTGRKVEAAEAARLGLVNHHYPDAGTLLAAAATMAGDIAAKSPLAIRGTKQVMNHARDHSVAEGLAFVAHWNAAMLVSDDIQVAILAQMSKSAPKFAD